MADTASRSITTPPASPSALHQWVSGAPLEFPSTARTATDYNAAGAGIPPASTPRTASDSLPSIAEVLSSPATILPDPQPDGRHAALTYLLDLSPGSRRVIANRLDQLAASVLPGTDHRSFPWHRLEAQHVTMLRAMAVERYAPGTARQALSALRQVLKECWRLGYYDFDHFKRLSDMRKVPGVSLPAGRAIGRLEFLALMNACDSSRVSHARDRAALALLFGAGARRSEAVRLNLADYDCSARTVLLHGKGGKDRRVPLVRWAWLCVDAWLDIRGRDPGALLQPVRASGAIVRARLSGTSLYQQLARMIERAGVAHLSPHDLRKTFATSVLEETSDLAATQRLLGHSSPATTTIYDRRGEKAARAAVDTLESWFQLHLVT